uniref:Integrase catalytic domain-containing protein n=1 Tax=Trichuris muris TaxID=70415 RepID=A0A5S6QEJ5_TRIMR
MLIRRRIATVVALVEEYDLKLTVTLVKSAENRADALTRIPKRWLTPIDLPEIPNCAAAAVTETDRMITQFHCLSGHPGVKRTLYFVKRSDPTISERLVSQVVNNCDVCRSVDPAKVKWRHGSLHVERIWQRVSMDITHFRGRICLTLIDCGPSRYAIWRPLKCHSSTAVNEQLESIFCERGAPEELLTDNDTAFRSKVFDDLVKKWGVRLRFRCAYVPSGNGIIERCHRTVKVIAARKECGISEAVYWYNLRPRDDCSEATAPANAIYRYPVRVRGIDPVTHDFQDVSSSFVEGDLV